MFSIRIMNNNTVIANYFRWIARYGMALLSTFIFFFSLCSGARIYGGGIEGALLNSHNALPWLMLFLYLLLAWEWELVGGTIIIIIGLSLLYFFSLQGQRFFLEAFIFTFLIILLGVFFLVSWYLRTHSRELIE